MTASRRVHLTAAVAGAAMFAALCAGLAVIMLARTAGAETTGMLTVGCELIAAGLDGDLDVGAPDYSSCTGGITPAQLVNLDAAYGDDNGTFQISDLAGPAALDGNQLGESCTAGGPQCTLLIFVAVDDEAPVAIDLASGLHTLQNGAQDFTCNAQADPPPSLTDDADCTDVPDADGDGIVIFHVVNDTGDPGDEIDFNVEQENVEQSDTVQITGVADELMIQLLEPSVQVSASANAADDCAHGGSDINDAVNELDAPERTIIAATVVDDDGVELARIPIFGDAGLTSKGTFDSSDESIAIPATNGGVSDQEPSGTTLQTVVTGAGIAFLQIICGGAVPGTAALSALIDADLDPETTFDRDGGTVDLTVVAAPNTATSTSTPSATRTPDDDGGSSARTRTRTPTRTPTNVAATNTAVGGGAVNTPTRTNTPPSGAAGAGARGPIVLPSTGSGATDQTAQYLMAIVVLFALGTGALGLVACRRLRR